MCLSGVSCSNFSRSSKNSCLLTYSFTRILVKCCCSHHLLLTSSWSSSCVVVVGMNSFIHRHAHKNPWSMSPWAHLHMSIILSSSSSSSSHDFSASHDVNLKNAVCLALLVSCISFYFAPYLYMNMYSAHIHILENMRGARDSNLQGGRRGQLPWFMTSAYLFCSCSL